MYQKEINRWKNEVDDVIHKTEKIPKTKGKGKETRKDASRGERRKRQDAGEERRGTRGK